MKQEETITEKLTDFRQLNVWQKAHKLVLDIYEITKKFPKEEKNELVSRMRKAAMDVPIKIAEGFMRRSPKRQNQFIQSNASGIGRGQILSHSVERPGIFSG